MLWFLAIAAKRGCVVDEHHDEAAGVMAHNAGKRLQMTEVVLRPRVRFSGRAPSSADYVAMHALAHERCFIANSVTTAGRIEPRLEHVPAYS
jgi:organic hydroperoxide reductase OsmC/OhrA